MGVAGSVGVAGASEQDANQLSVDLPHVLSVMVRAMVGAVMPARRYGARPQLNINALDEHGPLDSQLKTAGRMPEDFAGMGPQHHTAPVPGAAAVHDLAIDHEREPAGTLARPEMNHDLVQPVAPVALVDVEQAPQRNDLVAGALVEIDRNGRDGMQPDVMARMRATMGAVGVCDRGKAEPERKSDERGAKQIHHIDSKSSLDAVPWFGGLPSIDGLPSGDGPASG